MLYIDQTAADQCGRFQELSLYKLQLSGAFTVQAMGVHRKSQENN